MTVVAAGLALFLGLASAILAIFVARTRGGALIVWTEAGWCGADWCGADWCGADRCGADWSGADWSGAGSCGAEWSGSDLPDTGWADAGWGDAGWNEVGLYAIDGDGVELEVWTAADDELVRRLLEDNRP